MMVEQLDTKTVTEQQVGAFEQPAISLDRDEANAEGALPLADTGSPPVQKEQKNYRAIARVQGALVSDCQKLSIVTDDGARFPVVGIRPGKLSLKLIALLPEERKGLFSFWPQDDDGVVIASFSNPENYVQNHCGPLPDEMLLSGRIMGCHMEKFVVRVKRNKGSGRGNRWFKGMSITVSSAPPSILKPGQWADLKLQRSGSQWVLPDD